MAELKAWLADVAEGNDKENGHYLKYFLQNFAKAIIALLDVLGEWPIDVQ